MTYDGIVTVSREASLFWTGEARLLSAVLYFSNKYLNILAYIIGMLLMAAMSDKVGTYALRCIDIARGQQR